MINWGKGSFNQEVYMFSYKGIESNLNICKNNQEDFQIIIDFLFQKYNIDKFDNWKIVIDNINRPSCNPITKKIILNPGDKNLLDYQKLDYQFSHELTHAIQYYQKRGLNIEIDAITFKQKPFPNHSYQETEAIANSIWIIERVLKYNYDSRIQEDPDYYDYLEAFMLVDQNKLNEIWMKHSGTNEGAQWL